MKVRPSKNIKRVFSSISPLCFNLSTHTRSLAPTLSYVPLTLSFCCFTRMGNVWPVHRAVLFGTLTFSFSQFLPRTLPSLTLTLRCTALLLTFFTGRKFGCTRCTSLYGILLLPLFFISVHKFGAVISGGTEPVFLRIILCAGLKP